MAYTFWNKHVLNRLSPPWKNKSKLHPLWKNRVRLKGRSTKNNESNAAIMTFVHRQADRLSFEMTPWFVFFFPKFCFCWWRISIEWKEPYIYTVGDLQDHFKGNKKLVLNIFYFLQLVFHQASGYSTIQGVVFSMGCSFPLPWSLWVSLDATPSLRLCLVVLKEASKRTCVPLLVHWGLWGSKYLAQ